MDCDPQLFDVIHNFEYFCTIVTLQLHWDDIVRFCTHLGCFSVFSLSLFFLTSPRWRGGLFTCLHLSQACTHTPAAHCLIIGIKGMVVAVHHGGKLVVNKIPVFVLTSCITLSNCSSLCVLISSLPEVHYSLPGAFTCVPLRSVKIKAGHFPFLLWVCKPLGKQGLTCLSPFRTPANLLHLPWIPASPAIPQTQKLIRSKSHVLLTLVNLNSSLAINYLSADPPWAQQLRLFPAQLLSCQLSIQSIL